MIYHEGTNGATLIVQKYFDHFRCEFCSKEELINRYPNPDDYYLCYDTYSPKDSIQTLLWAYSSGYFNVMDLEYKLGRLL